MSEPVITADDRRSRRPGGPWRSIGAIALALGALQAPSGAATEVRVLRAQTAAALAQGTLDGVSLDLAGVLRAASPWRRLAEVTEPFVFTAAPRGDGWVLGTGNGGKVLAVDAGGRVSELFAVEEPVVFALWVDADGTVFAGSSPEGKVYRFAGGKAEVFFDPRATYIWGLGRSRAGELLVATGTEGRLFAVDARGQGRVLHDAPETHLRSLGVDPRGAILLGTAGSGRVLRLRADGGGAETLLDTGAREVVGFAFAPDGSAWAAAIEPEAGLVESAPAPAPPAGAAAGGAAPAATSGADSGSVTVALGEEEGRGAAASAGPRSEIFRLAPNGVTESVVTLRNDTVMSLAWAAGRLWMGTGLEGKLYSIVESAAVLEQDFEDRQVVALGGGTAARGPRVAVTTNAAGVHRAQGGVAAGTYTSAVLDAGSRAAFGVFRWVGEEPAGSTARFSFRSGLAREPDATWTAWTPPRSGREISLADLAAGRFVQWRAEFSAAAEGGEAPSLRQADLSYRAANARPRIRRFWALDPGEVLVPASFNPGSQIYEPAHPARDGIFDTLQPAAAGDDARLKTLWKRGMRTLRWEADDPNQDRLLARLEFRAEPASGDPGPWMPVRDELAESHYAYDETALPDGRYRFRLTISDAEANEAGAGLEAERTSEAVVVDSTPPELRERRRDAAGRLRVRVEDRSSPLRAASWSVDGAEWAVAPAEDGMIDGQAETFVFELPPGARFAVLRATDAAWNTVTLDLLAGER